jgi:hypothetical protein
LCETFFRQTAALIHERRQPANADRTM